MGLSVRQLRRLLAGYRRDGPGALAHGNRGRRPAHSLAPAMRAKVVEMAQGKVVGRPSSPLVHLFATWNKLKKRRAAAQKPH